jgi:hypothetical protein
VTLPEALCTGLTLEDLAALIFRTEEDGQVRATEDPGKHMEVIIKSDTS